VSLPRFFDRAADAAVGLGVGFTRSALAERLAETTVALIAPADLPDQPAHEAGFLFAADLAARLYPRIALAGPETATKAASARILEINPACEVVLGEVASDATLSWAGVSDGTTVSVCAQGWNVIVDGEPGPLAPAVPVAALAAGAIGMAELFRIVFADILGARGRRHPQPGTINLVIFGGDGGGDLPVPAGPADIGRVHLAGAGAIGQACAAALAASGVTGTLVVVDPEEVELSNLQRYVLTTDQSVGESKTAIVRKALAGSGLEVEEVTTVWGADDRSGPAADVVLVALDTPGDRIAVQAGVPRLVFNAWTQPADLGCSRHERFGVEPCLACLYWPTRPRPNRHELIAAALGQHVLRVLTHMVTGHPVNVPLPPDVLPTMRDIPTPIEAPLWSQRSLLDDVADTAGLDAAARERWHGCTIDQLYREGICGGALVTTTLRGVPQEVVVPVAHQSALAGVLLAAHLLVASDPELASKRPKSTEVRFDVLQGLPQVLPRPRNVTGGCLCQDPDFQAALADSPMTPRSGGAVDAGDK
jgi:hypothetical protein